MLNIFKSKKGVSPLIATTLLIAFAVALGSVVMNWGLNLNIGKSFDLCENAAIKIREISNSEVCYGGFGTNGYINFILDNVGSVDINGLTLLIIGEKGSARLFEVDGITLKKGNLYDKSDKEVTYDFSKYGNIKEVEFIPKISTEKTTEVCARSSAQAKKIGVCG